MPIEKGKIKKKALSSNDFLNLIKTSKNTTTESIAIEK